MTSTGKAARKRYGTRYSAKRAKARRGARKRFGQLPVSVARGNIGPWQTGAAGLAQEIMGPEDEEQGR